MFQKMCIPQERNNIRASENETTLALTHVDSWHRTVYPIFLLSELCDFIKTAYFKSAPKIRTQVQRSLEQSYTKDPRTTLPIYLTSVGAWNIPWQVFISLGLLQDSLVLLLALAVYNFLKQHLHTEVSARSSGFLAHIPLHVQNRSRQTVPMM